jgi:hypothetical protein
MKSFSAGTFVVLIAAVESLGVAAPRTSGIYLTAADYSDGRLTAEGDCGSSGHKLELHDVLNKSYIHATHGTETSRYAKSDLFGFRACDGKDYRFVSNKEFRILEAKELYIYEQRVGNGRSINEVYHFSKGSNGAVLPLTRENLKYAFPDNRAFQESLDQTFGAKKDLAQYDRLHKMFKVNWLLIATQTPEPSPTPENR